MIELSGWQRMVFDAASEGLSLDAVAARFGTTTDVVKATLSRCRRKGHTLADGRSRFAGRPRSINTLSASRDERLSLPQSETALQTPAA